MVLINQFINFKIGGVTVSANSTELNYNAGVTAGTALADKTLVLDTNLDVSGINHLSASQLTGTLQTASQPNITSLGKLTELDINGTLDVGDTSGASNGVLRTVNSSGWIYMQPGFNNTSGSGTHFFITNYLNSIFTSSRIFSIMSDGKVGIQSYSPTRQLEINSSTGNNLRLTYNDKDGSASNYADFFMSSGGNLTITTSGELMTITKKLKVNNTINSFAEGGLIIRTLSASNNFEGRTIKKEVWSSEFNIVNYDPEGMVDNYSLAVYGYIKPVYSQTYTFYIEADDEIRLWVNGELLFVDWTGGNTGEQTAGTISLTADIWYPIYVEFVENTGGQKLVVRWSSTSQTKQIIQPAQMAWDDETPAVKHNFSIGNKLTLFNKDDIDKKTTKFEVNSSGNLNITPSGGDVIINTISGTNTKLDIHSKLQILEDVGYGANIQLGLLRLGVAQHAKNFNVVTGYTFELDTAGSAGTNSKLHLYSISQNNYNNIRDFKDSTSSTNSHHLMTFNKDLIGIGTTAPAKQLEINSSTGNCLRLTYNDSNGSATHYADFNIASSGEFHASLGQSDKVFRFNSGILIKEVNALAFRITNDSFATKFVVDTTDDNSTKVGIGGSPNEMLHLKTTGRAYLKIESDTDNTPETDTAGMLLIQDGGAVISTIALEGDNDTIATGTIGNALVLNTTHSTQNMQFGTLNTIRMTINPSGNIGIGTNVPRDILHIKDAALARLTTFENTTTGKGAYIEVNNNAGTRALFGPDGGSFSGGPTSDVLIGNWSNGNLAFRTNALEYMRISSTGNVGISNTSPAYKLDVTGNINLTGNILKNGIITVPTISKSVNMTSGYLNTRFYPVALRRSVLGDQDHDPIIEFQVGGQSLGGGDAYNENTIIGFARGGGWSDHRELCEVSIRKYTESEYRFLGIYEGSSSFTDGIVIYVRGGYHYTFTTNADNINVGTSSAALTINASTFAIKDINDNDLVGTTSNVFVVQSLIVISGKYVTQRSSFADNVGIKTTYADRALEINDSNGNCLRLTYNDSNGGAGNYCDFTVSSIGDLFINPSGQDINIDGRCWMQDGSGNTQFLIGSYASTFGYSEYSFLAGEHTGGTRKIALGMNDNNKTQVYIEMQNSNNTHNDAFIRFATSSDDQVDATEKMRLTHDGKLGIGISDPVSKLHIRNFSSNSVNNVLTLDSDDDTNGSGLSLDFVNHNTYIPTGRINNYRYGSGDFGLIFSNYDSTLAEHMVLRNKGLGLGTNNPLSKIHIKQISDNATDGIKWEESGSTNNWTFWMHNNNNLELQYNGTTKAYLSYFNTVGQLDFTGQHRSSTDNIKINNNPTDYIGLIVSSTGIYNNINGGELNINEALPKVDLSNVYKDKKVYGVISNKEEKDQDRVYEQGTFATVFEKVEGDERLIINSVGEGMIWVCDKYGSLENGDLITSCEVPGYGSLQDNEFICNYTVGKITQDCIFTNPDKYIDKTGKKIVKSKYNKNTHYRCCFVGCVYYCG